VDPEAAMRAALAQARRVAGRTFPNPAVGAVVFRGDRVLGRGATRPPGGAHAEVVALERALAGAGRRSVRGASLAVTLEPCCFTGRTGPCTEAIQRAGISRVLVGMRDPHPRVRGRGIRALRAAGLAVRTGVLEASCREHHRGFLAVHRRGRPFVSLKLAATLDGRIATARGESRWISSPRSREQVQRLRAGSDALLVGSGTVRADDPELVARGASGVVHRPVRVIVDSGLVTPAGARVVREARRSPTWILTGPRPPARRTRALEAQGVRLLRVARRGGHLDLPRALARLAEEGLTSLLCEGGGGLAAALLRADLVDEVHWFVAPRLLGGDARPALGPLSVTRLASATGVSEPVVRVLGPDVYIRGVLPRARGGKRQ
jgi:diaminohydroxyphosphoribosylaminopyrimidine deaminase/5-amino-6-(5-phosphoribosylamino)uracil reductase